MRRRAGRRRRRVAQDDLGRQTARRRPSPASTPRRRARSRAGRARAAAAGPSTGGRRQRGRRDVVEAGDRHGAGHVDAELRQPLEGAEREQVVGAADRRERRRRPRAGRRRRGRRRRVEAVVRTTSRSSYGEARRRPGPRRYPASRSRATNSDAGPARNAIRRCPSPTSARDHRRDPGLVVDAHLGLAGACGERWTTAAPSARIAARWRSISSLRGRVVEAAAGEHDGRRADRAQQPDVRALAVGVALGAARDHEVAGGRRRVLDPAHDLGEVRVGDVVDDDRHHRHVALEQAAGERVRDVVERPGRLEDALPGRRR